jgi:hypothetical protein
LCRYTPDRLGHLVDVAADEVERDGPHHQELDLQRKPAKRINNGAEHKQVSAITLCTTIAPACTAMGHAYLAGRLLGPGSNVAERNNAVIHRPPEDNLNQSHERNLLAQLVHVGDQVRLSRGKGNSHEQSSLRIFVGIGTMRTTEGHYLQFTLLLVA